MGVARDAGSLSSNQLGVTFQPKHCATAEGILSRGWMGQLWDRNDKDTSIK